MIARVSNIAAFVRWLEEDSEDMGWLVNQITTQTDSEAALKGTAFHKIMQNWDGKTLEEAESSGYRFVFECDATVVQHQIREFRVAKNYGPITVTGCCDGIGGNIVRDHKTCEQFDAEKYISGWQWRYYLDLFGASQFQWYVWEMREYAKEPRTYIVKNLHTLSAYAYPEMHQECKDLAGRYYEAMKGVL